jgi:hypothetical protein
MAPAANGLGLAALSKSKLNAFEQSVAINVLLVAINMFIGASASVAIGVLTKANVHLRVRPYWHFGAEWGPHRCIAQHGSIPLRPAADAALSPLAVYALGGVSGAHFNPAVSIMLLLKKKVSFNKALAYIAAQVRSHYKSEARGSSENRMHAVLNFPLSVPQ